MNKYATLHINRAIYGAFTYNLKSKRAVLIKIKRLSAYFT
jgi:hypothetical protein